MIEVEVKLRIDNIDAVNTKLNTLGFKKNNTVTEIDTYFDNNDGDIRSSDTALRIRETTNHTNNTHFCQINFKGKKYDNKSMTRPEFETTVDDSTAMMGILNGLGYFPVKPIVKKKRIELKSTNMNACLDTVEGLGDFLELEIITDSEDKKDESLGKIEKILVELGYKMEDTTTTSYLSQLCSLSDDI